MAYSEDYVGYCQEEKHLIDVFNAVKLLIPWISKFGTLVAEIHTQDPQDEPVLVPVAALRWAISD